MPGHSKFCSLLIFLLIFNLIFYPVLLRAQSSSDKKSPPVLSLAVVAIHDGQLKVDKVERVADALRNELMGSPRYRVLSKEQTLQFFQANPHFFERIDSANPLNRYLDQAKEFYKTFAFKDAIQLLENTIETYRSSPSVHNEHFALVQAYLLLGNIALGAKDKKRAQQAFREAIRLDPEIQMTEVQFPPKTVRFFEKVREDYLHRAKSTQLVLRSSPNRTEVYLNGIHKGSTPLTLSKVTTGDHFVWMKREGYLPQGKKLHLKTPTNEAKLTLSKGSKNQLHQKGLDVTELNDVEELVRLGTAVGNALGVDKLVLVGVEEVGWNHKISARMIDLKYRASHKRASVEVLDLSRDTASATQLIAKDLNAMADVDLAKNPKRYAESEVVVVGKKKKKSFLKSPILWGIVGALVAGGAVTALVITSGGGGEDSSVTVSGATGRVP